jgi:hypothetical protein
LQKDFKELKKTILFLGDSFTWGEGLELYCDTPKWKNERFVENNWPQLVYKQDIDGIQFREANRFPTLVSNELECNIIVDKDNGGSLNSFIRLAEANLYNPHNTIETIIIQISCLDREMYHLQQHCKCEVCVGSNYSNIFPQVYMMLEKIYKNKALNNSEKYVLDFFENKTGYKITDKEFFLEFDKLKFKWYDTIFKYFINDYVQKWKANGLRDIYFIDSWDEYSSNVLFSTIDREYIIPLIGKDDKLYHRWVKWENTFKYRRINSEFPNTKNQHPTVTQHNYIANSIINFLNNKKKKII